ncbi:MAG: bifunctional 3,4-dihydroxy-2-butanone-4-phosphate synthase/GTP cyclohydrolase II [Candidatus Hinthialibacter antarcticus]|nr:bifunctional 3,4-dihydroxy-2-butanone-4-phosphate synthase/GTP cyclohydrolase II [Candidatus Hinthialibacter antarcticus]
MIVTPEEAVERLKSGQMLVVVDDENRENEGDIVLPAETITPEQVNFILSEARGLLCVSLPQECADQLELNLMEQKNTALHNTNFTVSVDAVKNTTTGISAFDRAETIRQLADPNAKANDFARPGHIFPLIAKKGGVLRRSGHTEAVVDLLNLAGFEPVGVLCEILNEDGSMARLPDLQTFAKKHDLPIVTIESLIAYRRRTDKLIDKVLSTRMPTQYGQFQLHLYLSMPEQKEHLALTLGDLSDEEPILVRVHSACLTGDVLGSMRCDCGEQLHFAMEQIRDAGRGVMLYMPQEGRGIGLVNKLKAYVLQDQGLDTVEANLHLGFKADDRDYGIGSLILADLGIKKMRLMTNNPKKIVGLSAYGLEITEQIPVRVGVNEHNLHYLETKRQKMGHLLEGLETWRTT